VAKVLVTHDKYEQLLNLIQRSWHQVETREEALTLFSVANTVISYVPDIGTAFLSAFSWVDNFLGG
jgi:hypothetical protein